jgi:hypothetical protein
LPAGFCYFSQHSMNKEKPARRQQGHKEARWDRQ